MVAGLLGSASRGIAAPLSPGAILARQRVTAKELVALRPAGPNPYLSFLPAGATPDYAAWSRWLRAAGQGASARSQPPVDPTKLIAAGESEPNGTQATADAGRRLRQRRGRRSGGGRHRRPLGAPPPPTIIGPFAEDDGSIPLASPTGLTSGATVQASGTIGDGPYGSGGTGTGDFDFFSISGARRRRRDRDRRRHAAAVLLRPRSVRRHLERGRAPCSPTTTTTGVTYDSYLAFTVPAAGTYYVSIGGVPAPCPSDPFDSASGTGFASEGTYDVTLGVNALDRDYFSFDLEPAT